MKSRIVPLASGLLLSGVSLIAAAHPQTLSETQLDRVAAGATSPLASLSAIGTFVSSAPTLVSFSLGNATANLSACVTAARDAAASIQAALNAGAGQANLTAVSLPQLAQAQASLAGIASSASLAFGGGSGLAGMNLLALGDIAGTSGATTATGATGITGLTTAASVTGASSLASIQAALAGVAGSTPQATRSPVSMSSATSTLPR